MRVRIFVQISAMEQDPPRAVLRGDYLWRWDVVKIRQHSIMHDPAVNAAFLNGWTPTPVPGAPPAPPGESERDEEGPLNLQFGPIVVEQVLSPGASRTVDLQVLWQFVNQYTLPACVRSVINGAHKDAIASLIRARTDLTPAG